MSRAIRSMSASLANRAHPRDFQSLNPAGTIADNNGSQPNVAAAPPNLAGDDTTLGDDPAPDSPPRQFDRRGKNAVRSVPAEAPKDDNNRHQSVKTAYARTQTSVEPHKDERRPQQWANAATSGAEARARRAEAIRNRLPPGSYYGAGAAATTSAANNKDDLRGRQPATAATYQLPWPVPLAPGRPSLARGWDLPGPPMAIAEAIAIGEGEKTARVDKSRSRNGKTVPSLPSLPASSAMGLPKTTSFAALPGVSPRAPAASSSRPPAASLTPSELDLVRRQRQPHVADSPELGSRFRRRDGAGGSKAREVNGQVVDRARSPDSFTEVQLSFYLHRTRVDEHGATVREERIPLHPANAGPIRPHRSGYSYWKEKHPEQYETALEEYKDARRTARRAARQAARRDIAPAPAPAPAPTHRLSATPSPAPTTPFPRAPQSSMNAAYDGSTAQKEFKAAADGIKPRARLVASTTSTPSHLVELGENEVVSHTSTSGPSKVRPYLRAPPLRRLEPEPAPDQIANEPTTNAPAATAPTATEPSSVTATADADVRSVGLVEEEIEDNFVFVGRGDEGERVPTTDSPDFELPESLQPLPQSADDKDRLVRAVKRLVVLTRAQAYAADLLQRSQFALDRARLPKSVHNDLRGSLDIYRLETEGLAEKVAHEAHQVCELQATLSTARKWFHAWTVKGLSTKGEKEGAKMAESFVSAIAGGPWVQCGSPLTFMAGGGKLRIKARIHGQKLITTQLLVDGQWEEVEYAPERRLWMPAKE